MYPRGTTRARLTDGVEELVEEAEGEERLLELAEEEFERTGQHVDVPVGVVEVVLLICKANNRVSLFGFGDKISHVTHRFLHRASSPSRSRFVKSEQIFTNGSVTANFRTPAHCGQAP